MNPTNPTNSRPSTAYGPPPLFDLTTPIIEIPLPIQMTLSTPSNVTDLENLRELFQQNQIDQNLLFEKALKAATYGLSKAVITNARNDDLVNAAAEARKRKKGVAGANRRARVGNEEWLAEMARKDFERYWSASIYGKEHYDEKGRVVLNLGFNKLGDDIFMWESTAEKKVQRHKEKASQPPKTPCRSTTQVLLPSTIPAPTKQACAKAKTIRLPLIRTPLRPSSRPQTLLFKDLQSPQKRRKHKLARRAQETEVTRVITHVTRRGRSVRSRVVEYK
jgi:hypothetical protein